MVEINKPLFVDAFTAVFCEGAPKKLSLLTRPNELMNKKGATNIYAMR